MCGSLRGSGNGLVPRKQRFHWFGILVGVVNGKEV